MQENGENDAKETEGENGKNWKKIKNEKTTILYDLSAGSEKDPIKACNKEKESISRYATANQISNLLPPIKS